jgi:hypothetical protein
MISALKKLTDSSVAWYFSILRLNGCLIIFSGTLWTKVDRTQKKAVAGIK